MRMEYNHQQQHTIKIDQVLEPRKDQELRWTDNIKTTLHKHGYNTTRATHLALERKLKLPSLGLTARVDSQLHLPPGNRQQIYPFNISLSSLLQVCLDLPLCLFPCRFQNSACLAMLPGGLLNVCPIHRQRLFLSSFSPGICLVFSRSSSFVILSYHLSPFLCKHLFMKVCSFLVEAKC